MFDFVLTLVNSIVVVFLVFDHWKKEKKARENFDGFVDEAICDYQGPVWDEFVSLN